MVDGYPLTSHKEMLNVGKRSRGQEGGKRIGSSPLPTMYPWLVPLKKLCGLVNAITTRFHGEIQSGLGGERKNGSASGSWTLYLTISVSSDRRAGTNTFDREDDLNPESTKLGEINSLDSKLSFLAATVAQDKRALSQKIVVMSEDEVDAGSALSMGTSSVGRRVDTTSSGLPSHGLDTDTRSKAHSSPSSPPVSLAAFETL
ncbi:hypothetical protein EV360DRAFT_87457 [Lentinula raphanica]|nr:hypothetical protein EV360DRAFT_87457 [Lentinula raphanica]